MLTEVLGRHELVHLYGQKRPDQSCTRKESWYIKQFRFALAGPISLGTLATYKQAFDEIRVNGRVSKSQWASFMVKIRTELAQTTLIVCPSVVLLLFSFILTSFEATVLLAANLAFLAIPSVDAESWPAIFSQISIFASLASIGSGYPFLRSDWIKPCPQLIPQVPSSDVFGSLVLIDCCTETILVYHFALHLTSCIAPMGVC